MRRFSFAATTLILLAGGLIAAAQGALSCDAALQEVWTVASDACISGPVGYLCNGGGAPQAEPAGALSNALNYAGAMVEVGAVDALRTPLVNTEGTSAGAAWLRLPAPIEMTALLVGDVTVRDATPPDFPAWQSMVVQTSVEAPACGAMPRSALILQSPFNQGVNIAVNGVSLGLNGTVMVRTNEGQTLFGGLSGVTTVFAVGQSQTLRTGQQIMVPHNPGDFTTAAGAPGLPTALDVSAAQYLPIPLLDRPIIIPQPGYVTTQGAVNLRISPNTGAEVLLQVAAGQVLSVLGRSSGGDWLHVRLDSGETGWMLGELLLQNLGQIYAVYDATPLPPQRYGELGRRATVLAPAGVNLRSAPDATFPAMAAVPDRAVVTLLARSPYSPWVKVDFNGQVGWIALIALETEAVIDALAVDYDVPPPPEPTTVPGSFGNAFPDPSRPGN